MEHLAIYGAPGCGKTHELKKRYLALSEYEDVLMTTFRKDTADEFRYNIAGLKGCASHSLKKSINTIHGACYHLLGGRKYAEVINDKDIQDFNKETGFNFTIPNSMNNPDNGNNILDSYAWLKNTNTSLQKISNYPNFPKLKLPPWTVRDQITAYEAWKRDNGKIDFSDMLTEITRQRLSPDVSVLMVDEFQDLTYLQHQIFQMWRKEMDTVIIAGDPLQSIYGFWGGTPDYFDEFCGDRTILPKSYRLPAEIWDYAKELVHSNDMQTPDIDTASHTGKVRQITYREYISNPTLLEGTRNNTVFHLVRSNYQAPAITNILAENGILWSGCNGWTLGQITILNAIIHARTGRVLHESHLKALIDQYSSRYFNHRGNKENLKKKISNMKDAQLPEHMSGIIKPELYAVLQSSDPVASMTRPGILKTSKINNALKRHTKPVTMEDINTTVTTIHGSKGLEADRVFLHTGITKNIQKQIRYNPATETRVFFVGITRAHKELFFVKDKGLNFNLPRVVA